ncbi:hypothetical protein F53441_11487 [Fusarium austroafricanum]|uniref:Uncharacterized protein n=1 Tax=Fusarium austroafricanum TaxID=2364996 RepID=A0A8H4NS48_9HYPO|nr:hypothetical protein F53441_11487 [Fusarium austroafricanum]
MSFSSDSTTPTFIEGYSGPKSCDDVFGSPASIHAEHYNGQYSLGHGDSWGDSTADDESHTGTESPASPIERPRTLSILGPMGRPDPPSPHNLNPNAQSFTPYGLLWALEQSPTVFENLNAFDAFNLARRLWYMGAILVHFEEFEVYWALQVADGASYGASQPPQVAEYMYFSGHRQEVENVLFSESGLDGQAVDIPTWFKFDPVTPAFISQNDLPSLEVASSPPWESNHHDDFTGHWDSESAPSRASSSLRPTFHPVAMEEIEWTFSRSRSLGSHFQSAVTEGAVSPPSESDPEEAVSDAQTTARNLEGTSESNPQGIVICHSRPPQEWPRFLELTPTLHKSVPEPPEIQTKLCEVCGETISISEEPAPQSAIPQPCNHPPTAAETKARLRALVAKGVEDLDSKRNSQANQ